MTELRLDPQEQRVLGSLLEKQVTVPASYPLSLNALRTACNQTSSRDPVVDYDERTVEAVGRRLKDRGLLRIVWSDSGRRTLKYHQTLDEQLELADDERALLTVLLLRGPQAPGELRTRTDRLHAFADRHEVEEVLARMAGRGLVREQPRRSGERDARWVHLLGEPTSDDPAGDPSVGSTAAPTAALPPPSLTTARLRLRPFDGADADALVALHSNARVLRYWDAPPWKEPGRAEQFLAGCRRMADDGTGVRLAVDRVADGAFLGWCSLTSWNPDHRSASLGYVLDDAAWGQGYATEAVQALLRWAFGTLDLNRVQAETDTRNLASARVLEKLGFVREGTLREDCVVDGEVSDSWVYGLIRRDWETVASG